MEYQPENNQGSDVFQSEIDHLPKDVLTFLENNVNKHQFHLLECQSISPGIDSNVFRYIMILDGPFDYFLSRNKGCYPGQEVVEKVYNIGRRPKKWCVVK